MLNRNSLELFKNMTTSLIIKNHNKIYNAYCIIKFYSKYSHTTDREQTAHQKLGKVISHNTTHTLVCRQIPTRPTHYNNTKLTTKSGT